MYPSNLCFDVSVPACCNKGRINVRIRGRRVHTASWLSIHTSEDLRREASSEFPYQLESTRSDTRWREQPDTPSVSLAVPVAPVTAFWARQLMDSWETWPLTVTSMELPVTVLPYRVHVKLQGGGTHSAEQVKLAVTPISRESGPEMTTFAGPAEKRSGENRGFRVDALQEYEGEMDKSPVTVRFLVAATVAWVSVLVT